MISRGSDPSGSPAKADAATPEAVEELRSFLRESLVGRPRSRAPSTASAAEPAEQHGARRSSDETDELLRMRAEHVIRSAADQASALIAETRLSNERRWAEARSHADEIRLVAEAAAQRGLASAQETNAQNLEMAERRARELVESANAWVRQMLTGVSSLPMAVREMTGSTWRGRDGDSSADPAAQPPVWEVAPAQSVDAPALPHDPASERAVRSEPSPSQVGPPPAPSVTAQLAPTTAAPLERATPAPGPAERAAEPAATDPARLTTTPRIGGVELVVGSFTSFSKLAAFTRALQGLQGIDTVTTRQFYKNVVQLRVRYDGDVPLVTRLKELSDFAPVVVSASPTRIELRIRLREPGVSDDVPST